MVYKILREFIGHICDGASSRRTIVVWSIQEWATRNRRIARVDLEEPMIGGGASGMRTLIVHLGLNEPASPNELLPLNDQIDAWRREISDICPPQTSLEVRVLGVGMTFDPTGKRPTQTIYEATSQSARQGARH